MRLNRSSGSDFRQMWSIFTQVGDLDGHLLIEEVQDHDDDKVNAGSSDGGGQLRGDETANQLDLPQRVFDDARKSCEHGQSVRYHPDDTRHNQRNLQRVKTSRLIKDTSGRIVNTMPCFMSNF